MKRYAAAVALVLAVLELAACGGNGGGSSPSAPSAPAPQPVTTVLAQPTITGLRAGFGDWIDINVPSTGTLEAEFNWTFATNDVDIAMTTTLCPTVRALTTPGGCSILASDTSLQKPARFSFTVTQPGVARFWVVNYGPTNESGAGTIKLTTVR